MAEKNPSLKSGEAAPQTIEQAKVRGDSRDSPRKDAKGLREMARKMGRFRD